MSREIKDLLGMFDWCPSVVYKDVSGHTDQWVPVDNEVSKVNHDVSQLVDRDGEPPQGWTHPLNPFR